MNFATGKFEVKDVPVPTPGPGEVRVRVRSAGVCLSDVHLIDGTLNPTHRDGDEVTLGHEVAGEVESLGAGVSEPAVGTRVIVGAGKEVEGVPLTMGVDYNGGWAEYLVAPAGGLLPIPDGITDDEAAIIPDAVSTPWGAISMTGQIRPGEAVGVWGVGGLGVHGVQLLRFAGAAPIVAVDPSPAARERALRNGADYAFDPADPDLEQNIAAATAGHGLNAAIDLAGVNSARDQALQTLGFGGRLVLVGISGGSYTISNDGQFQYERKQVLGHYGSEGHHLAELVRLTSLGRIDLSGSISGNYALADAAKAVEQLTAKEGDPIRLILNP
jgi:D-arabinose 1-dehydrogenase-like Zn-dependent alcohol dehydrogenase